VGMSGHGMTCPYARKSRQDAGATKSREGLKPPLQKRRQAGASKEKGHDPDRGRDKLYRAPTEPTKRTGLKTRRYELASAGSSFLVFSFFSFSLYW